MDVQKNINESSTGNTSQRILFAIFLSALLISYFVHLQFRKKHYQECDSTLVYYLFQDQPQKGLIYANWNFAYAKTPLSQKTIDKIFESNWREQKITNEMINDDVDYRFKKDEIHFDILQNIYQQKKKDDSLFLFLKFDSTEINQNNNSLVNRMNGFLADKNLPFLVSKTIDSTLIPIKIRATYQQVLLGGIIDSIQLCKLNRILIEQIFANAIQKIAVREIINNKISFAQLYRILEVYATDEFISHQAIRQSMQFALGSTYSPAVGLFYYFIIQSTNSFNEFLSASLVLTITLFHLSALLLVMLLIRTNFSPFAAIMTGIIFLFSISLYSYSFHLGSTIWNIFTAIVWLFAYAWSMQKGIRVQRKTVSIITGILLFFNYLIFFYWAAFMLLQFFLTIKEKNKGKIKAVFSLALSQWFFFLLFSIVMLVFYQSAQGNRGNMKTFEEFYSVVLNFFSFFNQYSLLTAIQFGFACLCFVNMLFYLLKIVRSKIELTDHKLQLAYFFLAFVIVLALTLMLKLLGIAASRHILWITPIFFLCFAYFFDRFTIKNKILLSSFAIILVVFGFSGVAQRQLQTTNNKDYAWELRKDIDQFLIHDFIFDVYYNLREKKKNCTWSDDYNSLMKGKKYMFISQTHSFQQYVDSISPILKKKNIQIEVLQNMEKPDKHGFVAYSPVHYFHDRSNALYVTEFLTK